MKIIHQTSLSRANPDNVVEFDEQLNDHIWMRIYWWMITRDIDLAVENGSRIYATIHHTDLPYPSIANFISFDNVSDRDLLRWIHETEGKNSILEKQRQNLVGFLREYNAIDEWKGTI